MLTLTHPDGRSWSMPDEFALLTALTGPELTALVDLARAQAKMDAGTGRTTLRIADQPGAILHAFPCRHRRMHEDRGEPVPVCRWAKDTAGGYSCAECGTWAQPDSERARVLDRVAAGCDQPETGRYLVTASLLVANGNLDGEQSMREAFHADAWRLGRPMASGLALADICVDAVDGLAAEDLVREAIGVYGRVVSVTNKPAGWTLANGATP